MSDKIALPGALTGNFFVRAIRPAFHDAHRVLPRMRDRAELRRQSLKLRFWPEKTPVDESEQVLDIDWTWIQALKGHHIGELRIHDEIGGKDNLRVIFFVPQSRQPLPTLWVIAVLQKKSMHFTSANIATFKARKQVVIERFYGKG